MIIPDWLVIWPFVGVCLGLMLGSFKLALIALATYRRARFMANVKAARKLAYIVVRAVEAESDGRIEGEEKFNDSRGRVAEYLKQYAGVEFDRRLLGDIIEAQVWEMDGGS